jgi:hypothetical protein
MVCGVLMVGWGVSDWVILVMIWVMWVTIDLVGFIVLGSPCG